MTYQCVSCGSNNVKVATAKRFEAEATFYKSGGEPSFGTKEEEVGPTFLFCKNCRADGHPNDRSKFTIPSDKA